MSIATLLPELLAEVFIYHVANCRAWSHRRPYYKWTYITHVNRYWRAVALAYTRLWSYIPLLRPECVEAFLVRSGHAYLTLTLGPAPDDQFECLDTKSDFQWYTESFKVALGHLHWVTEVKIMGYFWYECQEVQALSDAPMLERFELFDSFLHRGDEMIFKFKQHRLKELVVRDSTCRRYSHVGPEAFNLTLDALRGIPTLEKLVWWDSMPITSPTRAAQEAAIMLPHLRFLHIEEKPDVASFLLDKIICPTTTAIHIEQSWRCYLNSGTEAEYVQLAESISSKLCGDTAIGAVQPLLALEIGVGSLNDKTITLRGWTTAELIDNGNMRVRTDAHIITVTIDPGCTPPTTLEILCNRLALSTVQTLSVGPLTYYSQSNTSNMFRWVKNVKFLWLSRWSVGQILNDKLIDFPTEVARMDGGQGSMLDLSFPHLMTLWLDIIDNKYATGEQED